jgi:two-component system, cell cycle response regulator
MGNILRQKSYEGIRAYVTALQLAQKALAVHPTESAESVRRISHSLHQSEVVKDPDLTQALAELEKASPSDIAIRLQQILPKLEELTFRENAIEPEILIVEDDPFTARALRSELSDHRKLYLADNLKDAKHLLAEKEISMLILDINLPDGDGRDLLIRVRQNPATALIPVIVLSSKQDVATKTEAFALGADAYFEKPFDNATLSAAVAVKLQRFVELTQRSTLDTVTRLPNRMVFQNAFARAVRLSSRTQEPLTIAIIDLDRFKSVNDISGHQMGDKILQKISALLLKTLRSSDLLVRWGGEEFAILFPDTDLPQARLALNKALSALRKQTFETPEGRPFRMTFSAGVTQVEEGMSVEQAIAEADRYLYLAKAAGRNHVLSKDDRLDKLKRNILLVEDDDFMASLLRRFLEKEGFRIFHARTGKMAMSLCSQAAFSLITLDVKLPDIDGFELLNRFRQTPTVRHVPIIMLTASSNEESVIRGFRMGADDYIVKPFSPSQFLARVNRFLEKQAP